MQLEYVFYLQNQYMHTPQTQQYNLRPSYTFRILHRHQHGV